MIYTGEYRQFLIEQNKKEYGADYSSLKFLSQDEQIEATRQREILLASISDKINTGYGGTKLFTGQLSPGCIICGEGKWSCLFINGLCNCRCFYCPTRQDEIDIPTTNTVSFEKAKDYTDYLERFYFTGASISGGEPFNTFENSLNYIKDITQRFGDSVHTWLYTNGTLVTKEKLLLLKDAGLKEIRFDIGAIKYNLKKAKLAVGVIPTVTVEIPAVPEDLELMKIKLKEMEAAGINHLNLHQLRLTPFNYSKLVTRNYTYLHGERVTVLESEITALKLIDYSLKHNINLPINYCSFVYKDRYQKAAARSRNGEMIKKSFHSITQNGYIRYLGASGTLTDIKGLYDIFVSEHVDEKLYAATQHFERLYFHPSLLEKIDFSNFSLIIGYEVASIHHKPTFLAMFKEIILNPDKKVTIEKKSAITETELQGDDIEIFKKIVSAESITSPDLISTDKWWHIIKHEFIPSGLQIYY